MVTTDAAGHRSYPLRSFSVTREGPSQRPSPQGVPGHTETLGRAGKGEGQRRGVVQRPDWPRIEHAFPSPSQAPAVKASRQAASFTFRGEPAMAKPRNVPKAVALARARVAGLTARGADPDVIAAARADLAAASAAADIEKWPQLPDQTRMKLAALVLAGGGQDAA